MSKIFKTSGKSASRVLIFLMFFVFFVHVAGSLLIAAADDESYSADIIYSYPFTSFPSDLSSFSGVSYSLPYTFAASDNTTFYGFKYTFDQPVLLSSLIGTTISFNTTANPVSSEHSFFCYSSDGILLNNSTSLVASYTIRERDSDTNVWHCTVTVSGVTGNNIVTSVKDMFFRIQLSAPVKGYYISSVTSSVPFVPVQPDPEPPTPATGEWQAFTQFIFGIFGTMGSIINNLLAAGGLSSIFFGFVFGIPIANFIIFLIEEIFDLEPYDPSSSWRREEHSLKELRPADYNNYAGDPPSNRIGF